MASSFSKRFHIPLRFHSHSAIYHCTLLVIIFRLYVSKNIATKSLKTSLPGMLSGSHTSGNGKSGELTAANKAWLNKFLNATYLLLTGNKTNVHFN